LELIGLFLAKRFIYLASASARRQMLLRQIDVDFETIVSDISENPKPGEAADRYVVRAALEKAHVAARRIVEQGLKQYPVLGADTEVDLDGEILGKPRDRLHGLEMLKRLAGRTHDVLSAIAIVYDGAEHTALSKSRVTFAPMTATQIGHYWDTGEPADKAGGYAIQGRAGVFVRRIEGSYSGIVGLPLYELNELLSILKVDGT
jgi:septum formation protein